MLLKVKLMTQAKRMSRFYSAAAASSCYCRPSIYLLISEIHKLNSLGSLKLCLILFFIKPWSMLTYRTGYLLGKSQSCTTWKTKKEPTWGFLIHKIWQIMKYFSRALKLSTNLLFLESPLLTLALLDINKVTKSVANYAINFSASNKLR